jgi:1-acyl-sn-glycerol-3-phosphate acyltransferase
MQTFFAGDSYDTPVDTPRLLGDRLALGTRWYFTARLADIVIRGSRLARLGLYDDAAWMQSSLRTLRSLEGCGARFHIRGLDHIRAARPPVVFISNHMSTLETFVLPCLIAPIIPVTFVVKDSLVTHPFFGPIMRSRHPIVVARKNPREDLETVLREGVARLQAGISVVVFPQSTRSARFDPSAFNSLGLKLARRAGVPFLPIALKTDFWANGRYLRDIGPLHRRRAVHIEFQPSTAVQGNGAQQHEAMARLIEEHLAAWTAADAK